MHKKGDKVRIIDGYPNYIGKIGTILDDSIRKGEHCTWVKMEDGETICPFLPIASNPQCEFIEESVQEEKYSVDKIRDKNIWIACPTQEEWDQVCEILAEAKVKNTDGTYLKKKDELFKWSIHKEINGIGYGKGERLSFSPASWYNYYEQITAQQFIIDNINNNNMDKQTLQDKIVALEKELNSLKEEVNKPEWKPLAGEWVTYTGSGEGEWTTGKARKLSKVANNGYQDIVWACGEAIGVYIKDIRKATPAEIKEAENKSITLTIGSNSKTVVVKKDEIVCDDRSYKIGDLKSLVASFSYGEISHYAIHIKENIRFIRIGCESQDNMFSIEELRSVIKAYEKLNN